MPKREEIRIRDPFILTDKEHGCYYLYGTTALEESSLAAGDSFTVYRSTDLENFSEPKVIFNGKDIGFWADKDFWAPEVHEYKGKYYLFGSCKADDKCRATQIFVCDTPDGTFVPVSDKPVTPSDWECLDGTFWVEDGTPYIIFSHEWLQVHDGEIWAMPLKDDLSAPKGKPFMLFKASDAPDVTELGEEGSGNYVTDGPFLFTDNGKLRMIWSSLQRRRYLVLEAESESGKLKGPWKHLGNRYTFDGGHAMLFNTLDGKRMISLHSPNTPDLERAMFLPYETKDYNDNKSKKLFIYYSNTGSGDVVANRFSEKGYDIRKVTPKKDLPKSFFFKLLVGGFKATLKKKSKLIDYNSNVSDYDQIVIGSPIWNGRLSCPINTVLADTDLSGKTLSFVLYAGGGEAPKSVERLQKEYPNAKITVLKEPKKYTEELNKIEL